MPKCLKCKKKFRDGELVIRVEAYSLNPKHGDSVPNMLSMPTAVVHWKCISDNLQEK